MEAAAHDARTALVYRGHEMGIYRDHTYRRAMSMLTECGYPEPGDLGPREASAIMGRTVDLLTSGGTNLDEIALRAVMLLELLQTIVAAACIDNASVSHRP